MSVYLHVRMCTVYVVPVELRGGCWVPGTAATDSCELACDGDGTGCRTGSASALSC